MNNGNFDVFGLGRESKAPARVLMTARRWSFTYGVLFCTLLVASSEKLVTHGSAAPRPRVARQSQFCTNGKRTKNQNVTVKPHLDWRSIAATHQHHPRLTLKKCLWPSQINRMLARDPAVVAAMRPMEHHEHTIEECRNPIDRCR